MKKKQFRHPEQYFDGVYFPETDALRAIRAVADPRHHPNRTAALAMWRRIASTDLESQKLGLDEQQFVRNVAIQMIDADEATAKQRPDAVLAASGLYGTHRAPVETRIEEIFDALEGFDSFPMDEKAPTVVNKKFSKRDRPLAIFALDQEIKPHLPTIDKVRKRVNKVKDKRRK